MAMVSPLTGVKGSGGFTPDVATLLTDGSFLAVSPALPVKARRLLYLMLRLSGSSTEKLAFL